MARFSVLLIAVALIAGMLGCQPALFPDSAPDPAPDPKPGPDPDPDPDPDLDCREISSWHDLDSIRDNPAGDYLLMNDLDATTAGYAELASSTANQGRGWQPIGTPEDGFTGSFDGQGYQIRDLVIDRPDQGFVGLFGSVDGAGTIQSLGVTDAVVNGEWAVGILAGGNWGEIKNSYSAGTVSGEDCVGGLTGGNAGAVSSSYSTAAVIGRWDVGGLVGCNNPGGTVSKSYADGSVTGEWSVGGLVGGNLGGTVSKSYAHAGVTGDDYVGGLVGDNQGTVSSCYSTGSVSGQWHVGGLVGWNDSGGSVSNSYAAGGVSGDWHAGGLVGENDGGVISNSFWDTQASGMADSDGGTGKTSAAMQDMATFTDTSTQGLSQSWDLVAVAPGETDPAYTWNIVDGQTYPFLSWQPVS